MECSFSSSRFLSRACGALARVWRKGPRDETELALRHNFRQLGRETLPPQNRKPPDRHRRARARRADALCDRVRYMTWHDMACYGMALHDMLHYMPCHAMPWYGMALHAMLHDIILYYVTLKYSTVQYRTVQCSTVQYSTVHAMTWRADAAADPSRAGRGGAHVPRIGSGPLSSACDSVGGRAEESPSHRSDELERGGGVGL